jgi:hypothetical protein
MEIWPVRIAMTLGIGSSPTTQRRACIAATKSAGVLSALKSMRWPAEVEKRRPASLADRELAIAFLITVAIGRHLLDFCFRCRSLRVLPLRLAYLVLPDRMIHPFVAALSLATRHMPIWNQAILTDFIIEGHFSRHIRRMRTLYAERAEALQEAAQRYWSDFLKMPGIECGLDIAAALTPEIDDRAAAAAAAKADIELRPLSDHSRRRGRLNGFVVGFAAVDACSIRDGARQLARILERQIRKAGRRSERT